MAGADRIERDGLKTGVVGTRLAVFSTPTRRYNGPALADMNNHPPNDPGAPGRDQTRNRAADLLFLLLVSFVLGWYWLPATVAQGSTPHDRLFYLGVLPFALLAAIRAPWRALLGNPVVVTSLVLIGYLSLSFTWSREPVEFGPGSALLRGISTAAFLLAVTVIIRRPRMGVFRVAVVTAATSVAIAAIVRLAQGQGYSGDRLSSPIHFDHPNLFAHYLGFAAVLAIGAALRTDKIWSRWTWLGSVTVLTVAVLLTRSRTVAAALFVCLLASVALYLGRRTAALLALALVASGALMSVAMDGMLTGFVLRSDAGRDVIYRTLVQRLGNDRFFGAGIAADDDVVFEPGSEDFPKGFTLHHPHSAFVATLYFGGVVGLWLLMSVVGVGGHRAVEIGRLTGNWDPALLLLFGVTCLLTDGHRLVSHPHLSSWLLLWIPVGLIASYRGKLDQPDRRPTPGHETVQDLGSVAPRRRVAAGIFVTVAVLGWWWHPSISTLAFSVSWPLVLVSAGALFLLLANVLGTAEAGVTSTVYISTVIFLGSAPPPNSDLLGLAVVLIGARLWLDGLDREKVGMRWIGGVAMVGAGLFSPAVALTLGPPLWWWTRQRGGSVLTLVPIPATWIAVWFFRGGFSESITLLGALDPSYLTLALWLTMAHLVATRILGLAGLVPAVVGALLATEPKRRWLLWWFVGSCAGVLLLLDLSAPGGRDLIALAAPASTAIALGVLWIGRELVQIDLTTDVEAPAVLDEKRTRWARLLVMGLVLLIAITRLCSVDASVDPDHQPAATILDSPMTGR